MNKIERRDFIKKASIASLAGSAILAGCESKSKEKNVYINFKKNFEWKMVTAWPPRFPILGEGAQKLAEQIEQMSAGRLKITVYGGGELVPALESFDAVSLGAVEAGHSASYYWAGKAPAAQFFTGIPFGMNTLQTYSWLYSGGGLELWRELYEPFNLIPFPAGNTGAQMGGWFNKEINSIDDLQGLKIRQPGLGGKVITEAGAQAILSPGGEIYTNLERGVIDATEWIGPYHDYLMGFHKIAKYYYYPAWHEPTGVLEMFVNKDQFEKLPKDLQLIIDQACRAANLDMLAEIEKKNQEYLNKIIDEEDVEVKPFPNEVFNKLKIYSAEILDDIIANDEMSRKVYKSYSAYQKKIASWSKSADSNYGISI
ncbi:MAG: TRAP transporter substrate-binding protein [Ignavibacteriae bacterium]|nr:TRAP transporter substrate-binding protein [Ignavibacteriota bacterium]NOG98141.1 TRAP transporter substrate-binding protein [Ignavibacteriota bacterium]